MKEFKKGGKKNHTSSVITECSFGFTPCVFKYTEKQKKKKISKRITKNKTGETYYKIKC